MSHIQENREFLTENYFASAASCIFGFLSVANFYLTLKYGGYFMHLIVAACLMECIGYATIAEGDMSTYVIFPVAKLFLALVNYTVIGRLLRASRREFILCFRSQFVYLLLQASGVVTIFLQPLCGLMMGLTFHSRDSREICSGLMILLIRSSPFAYILSTVACSSSFGMWRIPELRKTFQCLFFSTGLIFISDVYHIFVYGSPGDSYVVSNEWPFIMFEMVTMLICCTVYTVLHFGKVTPTEFLRGDGKNERHLAMVGPENSFSLFLQQHK